MLPIRPNARQYRAGAAALVIVALLTMTMIAVAWVGGLGRPLLLPLVVAYFLFNAGVVFALIKGGLRTKGGRLGAAAILLNLGAMLSSDVTIYWTGLSAIAALAALVAAFLLFNEARAPTA